MMCVVHVRLTQKPLQGIIKLMPGDKFIPNSLDSISGLVEKGYIAAEENMLSQAINISCWLDKLSNYGREMYSEQSC